MTDDLDQKTDAALNELFAVEVAGWVFHKGDPKEQWVTLHEDWWISRAVCDRRGPTNMFKSLHPFCADANAVLPWLEKRRWHTAPRFPGGDYSVAVQLPPGVTVGGVDWDAGQAPTFARAAVIALIRATRAEKVPA